MKKILAAVILLVSLTACGSEWGNDAPVSTRESGNAADTIPAEIYNMPDGFSNVATKCDKYGNRMYTIYHGANLNSSPYGAVEVIPNDPSCAAYKVQPR